MNLNMSASQQTNWLNSMTWQADFYRRSRRVRRKDSEFEWRIFERSRGGRLYETRRFIKRLLHKLGYVTRPFITIDWMHENADALWNTRCMLADDLSRLLFDSSLIVRMTSFRRFYFPRIDFDDLVEISNERVFDAAGFPHDYLGMPLGVFDVRFPDRVDQPALK